MVGSRSARGRAFLRCEERNLGGAEQGPGGTEAGFGIGGGFELLLERLVDVGALLACGHEVGAAQEGVVAFEGGGDVGLPEELVGLDVADLGGESLVPLREIEFEEVGVVGGGHAENIRDWIGYCQVN